MSESIPQVLIDMLVRHEGLRLKPYTDTVGKLTIGYGRNLDDVGISRLEAGYLLLNDIRNVQAQLGREPWFTGLNEARQVAYLDMAFNVGIGTLRLFKNMIAAIQSGDFGKASDEMLASLWARQVGRRATELAEIVRTGELRAGN